MRTITIFYSLKGETIAPGYKIEVLEKGHTANVAETISAVSGSESYEIRTIKEYNRDHIKMIYEAKEEIDAGILPDLVDDLPYIDDFDLIFLGYPNWWNTLPTPVSSFLSRYDWKGKRIAPFCTSMASGFGKSLDTLSKATEGAEMLEGLHIKSTDIPSARGLVESWVRRLMR